MFLRSSAVTPSAWARMVAAMDIAVVLLWWWLLEADFWRLGDASDRENVTG
jgi:hypothetical protein